MKHLLCVAIVLCTLFARGQLSYIGVTRENIISSLKKKQPHLSPTDGETTSGIPYTYYMGTFKDAASVQKVVYFFDDKNICTETAIAYENEVLISQIKSFNDSYIKAGKFQWVNTDGDRSYSIVPEGDIFWIHITPLSK